MPRVISELCSNPDCGAHIDSEEVSFEGDRLWYADEINDTVDHNASHAGWQRVRREWFCPLHVQAELEKATAWLLQTT